MARLTVLAVGCLLLLAGCHGTPSASPAGEPGAETGIDPACATEQAGCLALSTNTTADAVRITAENVANETVAVNPDRWAAYRVPEAQSQPNGTNRTVAANAPVDSYNLSVLPLAPGETEAWELRYEPNGSASDDTRDWTLSRPGQYVFTLAAHNRTYTEPFQLGT
jgi:hypothetical protein